MLFSTETKQFYKKGPKQKDNFNFTFNSVQQSLYPEIGLVFTLGRITNSVGVFSVECGLAAMFVTLLTVTRPLYILHTTLNSVL